MFPAGVVLAIVAAFGLAGQALFVRLATDRGRPHDVLLVVMVVNVAVFVPITLLLVPSPTVSLRAVAAFVGAGIVGSTFGRAFFFNSVQRVGASRAEPVKASMPLFATVLAVLLLGERVSAPQAVGIALIVIGIAAVSWEGSAADRASGQDVPWSGLLFALAAAFFFGLEPIFGSFGLSSGTEVLVGVTIKTGSALVAFTLYLAWRGSLPRPADLATGGVRWYVLAGLSSAVFMLAYYAALAVSRVSVVVPIMQTSPLIVVLLSAAFLRRIETVTLRLVTAAAVIVAGGVTVTYFG